MVFKTITCWNNNYPFTCGGIRGVVKDTIGEFSCFLKQRRFLSPFQWMLLSNLIKRWNLESDYEGGAFAASMAYGCANSVRPIVLYIAFKFLYYSKGGFYLNGSYKTNDDLMIDLALKQYFESKSTLDKNCNRMFQIWNPQRINRWIRRKLDQKYNRSTGYLNLQIYEQVTSLIHIKVIREWTKEGQRDSEARQKSRHSQPQTLNSLSQIIKEVVQSWELGPPVGMKLQYPLS